MTEKKLKFKLLQDSFGVCKLDSTQNIPHWAYQGAFFAITKTADELSIICMETKVKRPHKCIEGPLF